MKEFKNGSRAVSVAFTLAEMMVVMLILSIVMAAFAPVMTRKSKVDMSSPWKWIEGGAGDIRYGVNSSSQMAIIGKAQRTAGSSGRLLINTNDNAKNHIIFETSGTKVGALRATENSILLGSMETNDLTHVYNDTNDLGENSVVIGQDVNIPSANTIAIGNGIGPSPNIIAIGNNALSSATSTNDTWSSMNSIAIGHDAAHDSTYGQNNVAIGNGALYENEQGDYNTAVGHQALYATAGTSLVGRTAIGYQALYTGGAEGSTAVGYQALYSANKEKYNMIDPVANTAVGYQALYSSTRGINNVAIGKQALHGNTTGFDNIAIGNSTLVANKTGDRNIAIGTNALSANSKETDSSSDAIGWSSSADNIAIGYSALAANTTAGANVAIGTKVLAVNTTGWFNTGVGNEALGANTTGSRNVAVGNNALQDNTEGSYNIAVGEYVLQNNKTGSKNTAIGHDACQNVTGSYKTCIGNGSGPTSDHDWAKDDVERIFIGSKSKFNDGPAVLEVHNEDTTKKVFSKDVNNASVVINGNLIVKGSIYTTFWNTDDSEPSVGLIARTDGQLEPSETGRIKEAGYIPNYWGNEAYGKFRAINNTYVSNSTGSWSTSDRRLKNILGENKAGLEEVKKLKVYNYTFKKDKEKKPHVGVVAQELQKIFPTAVQVGSDGYLLIRWDEMFYAVINAVKELAAKIDVYDKAFKQIQDDNKALKQEVKQLKEQNKKLEARLEALEAKMK